MMDDDVYSTIINDDSDFEQSYFNKGGCEDNTPESKKSSSSTTTSLQPPSIRDKHRQSKKKGIKITVNGRTFHRQPCDARVNPRRTTPRRADKRRRGSDSRHLRHSSSVHEKFWPPKEFFETVKADLSRMADNGPAFYRFTREWDRMHMCGSNTFTSMDGFVDTFGEEVARKIYLFMIATNGTLRSHFNHHRRDWEEVWRRDTPLTNSSNSLY